MEDTPQEIIEERHGSSRRDFLKKSAVTGAVVWSAPAISTLSSRAWAQTYDGDGDGRCTGQAYNVFVRATGLIDGTVGPLNQSPANQDFERDCIVDLVANLGGGNPEVVVGVACVENDFDGRCCTRSELTNVRVDLTEILRLPPLTPITLTADLITAEACAGCGATPAADSALANAVLTVGNNVVALDADAAPNTEVANLDILGLADVELILNEQAVIPGGIEVNAVHLTVRLLDGTQTVDVILGHAEADVHDCP